MFHHRSPIDRGRQVGTTQVRGNAWNGRPQPHPLPKQDVRPPEYPGLGDRLCEVAISVEEAQELEGIEDRSFGETKP